MAVAGKYLTFRIARQYYAVEAALVRSVLPAKDIVSLHHPAACVRGAVAHSPGPISPWSPSNHPMSWVRGAVTVRGRRVPVLDLRERLGLGGPAGEPRTVLVLATQIEDAEIARGLPLIGIVADQVTEIIEVHGRDVRGPVIRMRKAGRPYGRPKTVLSLAKLFSGEELAQLTAIF